VSDDKGHIIARLFALDALVAVNGDLPCAVKFVIEGEEETSSVPPPRVRVGESRAPRRRRLRLGECVRA
jgi:hypothetical protein